jgi:hypothetical protein
MHWSKVGAVSLYVFFMSEHILLSYNKYISAYNKGEITIRED